MKVTHKAFLAWMAGFILLVPQTLFAELISGYEFLSEQTQEMQLDDFQNPGYLLVESGLEIYEKSGENEQTCAECHGDAGKKLVPESIAQYPKYSQALDKPLTLRDQIQVCWTERLDNFPLLYDDPELLALETFIRNKAFGEKVNVDIDGAMQPFYEAGKKLYFTRFGQMDMTCAQCHDIYTGKMLRGQKLSQ
ncbi:MAG: sulfur oxidation c-type cytochrome SoxA [gamma proteobacterium symbiont of Bathyaustriella thionipta]|nr:sulfur oxidation c-type cytochrome SoxA [gamma proteobacterium symbiont of Bathyaustriella thionipta]MCU7950058.1 sulfur oxidation c-type cytochrome SoxA [gamma proteobacterium symbiont of Bathyaustriella thionipta]MCU7952543.1 sulfur oxidation c-type cytochrome SoxA [gamma proteobacterium symbiont of Bathyaustriella thionipta]MCU7958064.1 sulfur oxidation c-type cytochrome SoxA [gamma proteobacterium symbiont of Bathyaustriella thionipta]MCU7967402.1 sulfur oxidation c-type cytochrome SoxA 